MLNALYVEIDKYTLYAERRYAECRYAGCRDTLKQAYILHSKNCTDRR